MINRHSRAPAVGRLLTVTGSSGKQLYWMLQPEGQSNVERLAKLDQRAEGGRALILNRYAQHWTDRTMIERLQLCGIPTSARAVWGNSVTSASLLNGRSYVRTIVFWVLGSEVIASGVSSSLLAGGSVVQQLTNGNQATYRRLARIAVRTAYALGYDSLQVALQSDHEVQSTNRLIHTANMPSGVLDQPVAGDIVVQAMPVHQGKPEWVWERYTSAVRELADEFGSDVRNRSSKEDQNSFSVNNRVVYGLDCEFVLYDAVRSKVVAAERFLPLSGPVGCDAVRVNGKVLYPLLELRPEPTGAPSTLVRHVQRLLNEANHQLQAKHAGEALQLLAGSVPRGKLAIGCHIHFSGIPLHPELIRALDTYVALPLTLLEPAGSLRRRHAYGMPGDVRVQEHNGAGGFEYRTLPNFLHTPMLALDVLRLIEVVVHRFPRLLRRDAAGDEGLRIFISGNGARHKRWRVAVQQLLGEAAEQSFTKGQQQSIHRLKQLIESGWMWQEEADISPNWLRLSEQEED